MTLSPEHVSKLHARVRAARDAGYASSFSAEIGRALDEADGNLRSARHRLGNDLTPLRLTVQWLQSELAAGRRITPDDLKPIEDAVAKMTSRLQPAA